MVNVYMYVYMQRVGRNKSMDKLKDTLSMMKVT